MESEKVKEIKEKLQEEIFIANSFGDKLRKVPTKELENLLTLINELESENEEVEEQCVRWTEIVRKKDDRIKSLKDRIALLEKDNELLRNAKVVYENVDYCYEDLKKAEKKIAELEKGKKEHGKKKFLSGWKLGIQEFSVRLKESAGQNFVAKNGKRISDITYSISDSTINKILKEFINE